MNLSWSNLTRMQRSALRSLCTNGPGDVPRDVGEQLATLGLIEPHLSGGYAVSALGLTFPPRDLA